MSASRHIDTLIDETARAMTDGAPAGDVRAAVRRRLGDDRRPTASWLLRLATAAAVGGVLVAWNVTLRERTPPAIESGSRSGELMLAVPGDIGSPFRAAQRVDRASGVAAIRRPAQLTAVVPIVVESLEVEPLAPPGPMETEILDVPMPLLAERLDIEPLVVQ